NNITLSFTLKRSDFIASILHRLFYLLFREWLAGAHHSEIFLEFYVRAYHAVHGREYLFNAVCTVFAAHTLDIYYSFHISILRFVIRFIFRNNIARGNLRAGGPVRALIFKTQQSEGVEHHKQR